MTATEQPRNAEYYRFQDDLMEFEDNNNLHRTIVSPYNNESATAGITSQKNNTNFSSFGHSESPIVVELEPRLSIPLSQTFAMTRASVTTSSRTNATAPITTTSSDLASTTTASHYDNSVSTDSAGTIKAANTSHNNTSAAAAAATTTTTTRGCGSNNYGDTATVMIMDEGNTTLLSSLEISAPTATPSVSESSINIPTSQYSHLKSDSPASTMTSSKSTVVPLGNHQSTAAPSGRGLDTSPESSNRSTSRGRTRSRPRNELQRKQYRRPVSKLSHDCGNTEGGNQREDGGHLSSFSKNRSNGKHYVSSHRIIAEGVEETPTSSAWQSELQHCEGVGMTATRPDKTYNNNQDRSRPKVVDDLIPTPVRKHQHKDQSPTSVVTETLGANPAWFRRGTEVQQQETPPRHSLSSDQSDPSVNDVAFRHGDGGGSSSSTDAVSRAYKPASSSTPAHYTPPQDTMVILKDDAQEMHSSLMLAYASPVLAEKLKATSRSGFVTLAIPNGTLQEWKVLQPFLQPHSVQKAAVTTQNLALLLPWFHELKLGILLNECDLLLSTLTFANDNPSKQDWNDVALLAHICCLADLPSTLKTSMETLKTYLAKCPEVFCNEKANLDSIMNLLRECSTAREALWNAVTQYLPPELLKEYNNEKDAAAKLVRNSLFPYLFRERLQITVTFQQQAKKRAREREQLRRWHRRKKALEMAGQELYEMERRNSFLAEDSGPRTEPSWMQTDPSEPIYSSNNDYDKVQEERDRNAPFTMIDEDENMSNATGVSTGFMTKTSKTLSEKSWAEFAKWWQTWSQGKGDCQTTQASSIYKDRCGGQLYSEEGYVPKRTAWLESVLKSIKRPSLFEEEKSNEIASGTKSLSSTTRSFSSREPSDQVGAARDRKFAC